MPNWKPEQRKRRERVCAKLTESRKMIELWYCGATTKDHFKRVKREVIVYNENNHLLHTHTQQLHARIPKEMKDKVETQNTIKIRTVYRDYTSINPYTATTNPYYAKLFT